MPGERVNADLERRLVTGRRMMFAHVRLKRGAVIPRHRHTNEQITYVVSGALRFKIGVRSKTVTVHAGEVLHLPSMVWHAATVLERSVVIDLFDPPRRDWLSGADDYLRAGR